ncbi:MAG: kynureninase [Alphaproteobacteria bacterium]|nr:kynureninase [Alphaproteobacteria bacterium]
MNRADCLERDRDDPLRAVRDRFRIPENLIYLDGNSLGPMPAAAPELLARAVEGEWGEGLIGSWNKAGWIDLPARLGAKVARLIGAAPDQVIVADSTSVDLFKLLAGALSLRPRRRTILTEGRNFPTDLYIAEGLARLVPGVVVRTVEDPLAALDADTAILTLTHVDYRSGRRHDMAAATEAAHRAGALVLWDLSHSTGAMDLELDRLDVDLAVGCGYKFLNGGPGAPAYVYVARRHHAAIAQPIAGWMGHARPFDFDPQYRPAPGIARQLSGTPPILSMRGLEAGLATFDGVDPAALRAKSEALVALFLALTERRLAGHGFEPVTPRDPNARGSQASFRHREAYAVMQALIARKVVGDFRPPDIVRFGLPPLYLRFVDVWDAVERWGEVMAGREWDRPEFKIKQPVT